MTNIKPYDNDYVDSEGYLIAVYIRADKFYDSYERKVTDILTLLGDLGGLLEFFCMIGGLLVTFLAQKLFISSIIKKIYHIRKYENIEHVMLKMSNELRISRDNIYYNPRQAHHVSF